MITIIVSGLLLVFVPLNAWRGRATRGVYFAIAFVAFVLLILTNWLGSARISLNPTPEEEAGVGFIRAVTPAVFGACLATMIAGALGGILFRARS